MVFHAQCEPRFQRGKSRLGAALLEQPKCGIEHHETGDDRRVDILAEHQCALPWNRSRTV
jgi:hypothetical protein